jgi:hypothetical protein
MKIQFYTEKLNESNKTEDKKQQIENFVETYTYLKKSDFKITSNSISIKGDLKLGKVNTPNIPFMVKSCDNIIISGGTMSGLYFSDTLIKGGEIEIGDLPNLTEIDFPSDFPNPKQSVITLYNLQLLNDVFQIPVCDTLTIIDCNLSWLNKIKIKSREIKFVNCKDIIIDGQYFDVGLIQIMQDSTIKSIKNFKRSLSIEENKKLTNISFLDESCDGIEYLSLERCENITSLKSNIKIKHMQLIKCDSVSTLKGISQDVGTLFLSGNKSLKNVRFVGEKTRVRISWLETYITSLKGVVKETNPIDIFEKLKNIQQLNLRLDDVEQVFEFNFFDYVNNEHQNSNRYDDEDIVLLNYIKILNNHINIDLSEDEIKKLYSEIKKNNKNYPEFNNTVLQHIEELYPFVK